MHHLPNTFTIHQLGFVIRSRVCMICLAVINTPTGWYNQFNMYQQALEQDDEEIKLDDELKFLWCYRCCAMVCRRHVDRPAHRNLYFDCCNTKRYRCEMCLFNPLESNRKIFKCAVTGIDLTEKLKFS